MFWVLARTRRLFRATSCLVISANFFLISSCWSARGWLSASPWSVDNWSKRLLKLVIKFSMLVAILSYVKSLAASDTGTWVWKYGYSEALNLEVFFIWMNRPQTAHGRFNHRQVVEIKSEDLCCFGKLLAREFLLKEWDHSSMRGSETTNSMTYQWLLLNASSALVSIYIF